MKIVLLGKGEMLANLIQGVLDSGFEIAGVFRHERTWMPKYRLFLHDCFKSAPDVTLIKKHKLHEINYKSANSEEFKREILKLNADIILVGTWREKLKKEIIDLPKIATINVHPSYLPKYRGPNPYLQTILHGEVQSGITFHLMTDELDKGPILLQKRIDILPCDTSKELKEKTVFEARIMTCELLKRLNAEIIEPQAQNEDEATYYPNITGDEKMLDFKNMTSTEIINTTRALHPYLPTYITFTLSSRTCFGISGMHLTYYFITNPYKINITNIRGKAGQIVNKNSKEKSLTIICKDGIGLKLSGLKLYRLNPLTSLFIKYIVKI